MKQCLVCGVALPPPTGRGQPPKTCSPECAATRKREQREESRQRAQNKVIPDHVHGTSTGYTYYGCTCERCRKWAREYMQDRRDAEKAAATPPRVRRRS